MRPNRLTSGPFYLPGVVREGRAKSRLPSIARDQQCAAVATFERRSVPSWKAAAERCACSLLRRRGHRVDTYVGGEMLHLEPVGGGGTDFGPCFDWLMSMGIRRRRCLPDRSHGAFPESAPDYPVIWASTGGRQAPFGSVVPIHAA